MLPPDILREIFPLLSRSCWYAALSVNKQWNAVGYEMIDIRWRRFSALVFACQRRYFGLFERIFTTNRHLCSKDLFSIWNNVVVAGPQFFCVYLERLELELLPRLANISHLVQYAPDCAYPLLERCGELVVERLMHYGLYFHCPIVIEVVWHWNSEIFKRLTSNPSRRQLPYPSIHLPEECRRHLFAACSWDDVGENTAISDPLSWPYLENSKDFGELLERAIRTQHISLLTIFAEGRMIDYEALLKSVIQTDGRIVLRDLLEAWTNGLCLLPSIGAPDRQVLEAVCIILNTPSNQPSYAQLKRWIHSHSSTFRDYGFFLFEVCVMITSQKCCKALFDPLSEQIYGNGRMLFPHLSEKQHKTYRGYLSEAWDIPLISCATPHTKGLLVSQILDGKRWKNPRTLLKPCGSGHATPRDGLPPIGRKKDLLTDGEERPTKIRRI